MFILHLLIDVYTLFSDVSLRRQASMTRLRNSRTLFAQSDVNLFNHLVEADVAVVVHCGFLFFVDMRLLVFSVADLYCLRLFLR